MKFFFRRYWRNLKSMLINPFTTVGVAWTIISRLEKIFPNYGDIWQKVFFSAIVIAFVINIIKYWPKNKFEYQIKNRDIKITLLIGDILKQKGAKIVPTNTTFDTKMENDFISDRSIQGQVQNRFFQNNILNLDTLIEKELKCNKDFQKLSRRNSKNKQYPIGTVVEINQEERFYFLAVADINEKGQTINTSCDNIVTSLESLWNFIIENGHTEDIINIPIIGTGRMGLNEPREKIIKHIIFSFMANSNTKKVSHELVICIRDKDVAKYKIDINSLNDYLGYLCNYYYENTILQINLEQKGTPV